MRRENAEDGAVAEAAAKEEAKATRGSAPRHKDTVYCVGCRRKGHVRSKCPCRHIHKYEGTESESGSKGEHAAESKRRHGESRGSSDGRSNQERKECSECGRTDHNFSDGECPLLQDPEWEAEVQRRELGKNSHGGLGSSQDEGEEKKPKRDEEEREGRNAVPNFNIVHDMQMAIRQEGEELAEQSSSHSLTVMGGNAVETLERQDDRLEVNQRENQHRLKIQLDSSEECDE